MLLSGGHITPILVAAETDGIRIIDVRHEADAVFVAFDASIVITTSVLAPSISIVDSLKENSFKKLLNGILGLADHRKFSEECYTFGILATALKC